MIRRICNLCDKYFTPTNDVQLSCDKCAREFGEVKSQLAERTLRDLHQKFKKEEKC